MFVSPSMSILSLLGEASRWGKFEKKGEGGVDDFHRLLSNSLPFALLVCTIAGP